MKLINLFKNRTALGISCIVLAFLICFVISPLISRTSEKTVTVIRAAAEIKSGDEITKDMIAEIRMSNTNQPEDIVSDSKAVIGKYAVMDMTKGDYILTGKLSDTPYVENTYLAGLNGEMRAVSVTLKSFALGLSGKLKPGDIVSVIAPDYQKSGMTVIPIELQYIEVIAVTGKSGADVETVGGEDSELPSAVTLMSTETQSKILADLEKNGTLHLSLVYRGERKTAEAFLEAQKEVLNPPEETAEQPEENAAEAVSEGGEGE
ncbi:MAG: Flp pilus assembly protein CpaB [Clostridia bacterium]|nr:Flp pilus assembly protein CpaB [Clostridia bacterium]